MVTPERAGRQLRSAMRPLEMREADGAKHIRGYFVVFDDAYQLCEGVTESIDRNAFAECLSNDVRCLTDHDTRLVLGRSKAGTFSWGVDSFGVWGDALINEDDTDAMNTYARAKRGDVDQGSFGFDILDEEREIRADGSVHYTIRKVELYEMSLVTFPAYERTSVSARAADAETRIRRREHAAWLARNLGRLKNGTQTAQT